VSIGKDKEHKYLRKNKGLSHLFSETALEFVLTAESRHFCAVMAQKATSLGKFLRNLLKNRLCCRFFKTLPLNETAPTIIPE